MPCPWRSVLWGSYCTGRLSRMPEATELDVMFECGVRWPSVMFGAPGGYGVPSPVCTVFITVREPVLCLCCAWCS